MVESTRSAVKPESCPVTDPDPRLQLKNPHLAAVLTFLIPGAGQLYQGRTFKGFVFLFCILGTFLFGMQKSGWRAVYAGEATPSHDLRGRHSARWPLGFFAQAGMGLPSTVALLQRQRFLSANNPIEVNSIPEATEMDFDGVLTLYEGVEAPVDGTLKLEPFVLGGTVHARGTFEGTAYGEDGGELEVGYAVDSLHQSGLVLGSPLGGSDRRLVSIGLVDPQGDRGIGVLQGTTSRPFQDWFLMPPDTAALGELHGGLGKTFELAVVCTWIAGLLNILAIWDALEGPAYGIGDEEESTDEKGEGKKDEAKLVDAKPETTKPTPAPAT